MNVMNCRYRQMDGQVDEQTDKRVKEWINKCVNRWSNKWPMDKYTPLHQFFFPHSPFFLAILIHNSKIILHTLPH